MIISYLSLLLFTLFISWTHPNHENVHDDNLKTEIKIEKDETVTFNTLVKGSGSPTIIFESGLGTPLNNWDNIQSSISANYKTIAYDVTFPKNSATQK